MAAKGLTEAWRGAEAAKASDWTIRGVVLGLREVDPRVSGPRWAVGPSGERLQPQGESPHDALNTLALRLRDLELFADDVARALHSQRAAPTSVPGGTEHMRHFARTSVGGTD